MRFVPTRIHGMLDYAGGILLGLSPWILQFDDGGIQQWLPVLLGLAVIAYSLITDYELGLARILPMPVHLSLDGAGGALLAVSPWVFGFADNVWLPHLAFGLFEIGAAMFTRTTREWDRETGPPERGYA